MKLWHHLVSAPMLEAVETVVHHGWEVDSLLVYHRQDTARLHVAEILSRVAAGYGLTLPPTDSRLIFRLRAHQAPIDLRRGGCVTATYDGRIGWNLGDGTTIESTGEHLTHVLTPDPQRYRTQYTVPGLTAY